MERSDFAPRDGKTWAVLAAVESCGKGRRAECEEFIVLPSGSPTVMSGVEDALWTHGARGPRKWLVHPESAMA